MVTFTTQKTRIATEMTRADLAASGALETVLEQHYQDAVEFYANEKFWFNSILTTATTSAGVATINVPATVQTVERLTIPAYDIKIEERGLSELPDYSTEGIPEYYAYLNDTLRFWPIPDAAYTLNVYGVAYVAAPTSGSDDNIWTNQAAPLIRAHTKMTLFRSVFRDTEGATLAEVEKNNAFKALKQETARRLKRPLRSERGSSGFNINTGN